MVKMMRRSGFPAEACRICVSEFVAMSACPAEARLASPLAFPHSAITLPCVIEVLPE